MNLLVNNIRLTLQTAVCLCFLLWYPVSVLAWQDDPFDPFGANDPNVPNTASFNSQDAGSQEIDELSEGVRLLIQSLRDSNPSDPVELARAIRTMLDIEQFDEARTYLNRLVGLNPNRQQMFELSEELGPDFFLRLRDQPELQPAASQFADRLFTMAQEEAYSDERVIQLISQLSENNGFVRRDALRKLRLLGAPAVAQMLNVCGEEQRRQEIPYIRAALKQMGDTALLPLVGAARADGTVAQAVAVGALSASRSKLAHDTLMRAAISNQVPESVREIASDAVANRGLHSPFEIERAIYERTNEYLDGKVALLANGRGMVQIWNWHFDQEELLPTEASTENAARYLAIDMARDVYQLNPANPEYRMLQLLTVLEGTKRVLGPHRHVLIDEATRFVPDIRKEDLDGLLKETMRRKLWPAATAAAELAGQIGDDSLLWGNDAQPRPLVQAILTGYRPLQFAAARSIANIDPQHAYPGCSYVVQIMVLMANSNGKPAGVVVHPRSETAQNLASAIFQAGAIGVTANSSGQLFDQLESNPDIGMVLVTDASGTPHYQELVQQIRNYWLTKEMPVALWVSSSDRSRKAKRILDADPLTLVLPVTSDPRLVQGQIQRLEALKTGMPVGGSQLDFHAAVALDWLGKTLADPETYRFYHLACYRDQISRLGAVAGSFETKSDILSKVGTPQAQKVLVNLAGDVSLSVPERQAVADAFNQSVRRHGLLLTRPEIQLQYDRYNASASSPKQTQEILSYILDTIELKTRGRTSQLPGGSQ